MKYISSILLLSLSSSIASASSYSIIANKELAENLNSVQGERLKREIKLLFLKQKASVKSSAPAKPASLPVTNKGFEAFRDDVLKMTQTELDDHWVRIRQITGDLPPREYRSNRSTLRYVAKNPGGFGIVESLFAKENPNVTVLLEFGGEE